MMAVQNVLIITGMHRSGTSLAASILQNAGVTIGTRLMGSARGNPRGHFEDLDFYTLHNQILERNQKTFLVQDIEGLRDFTAQDIAAAEQLVADRAQLSTWGWKDPRTTLFLDFWKERIPQAVYLFLYRSPISVVHSLLRRAAVYPENDAAAGLKSWGIYNQEILDFARQNPEKSFIGNIDRIAQSFPNFISTLNKKFGLSLNEQVDSSIFASDELTRVQFSQSVQEAFLSIMPEPFLLYDRLEQTADMPGFAQVFDEPNGDDAVRLVLAKQLSNSLTAEAKLQYLFAFIDPQLVHNTASRMNDCASELQNLKTTLHDLKLRSSQQEAQIQNMTLQIQTMTLQIQNMAAQIADRDQSIAAVEAHAEGLTFLLQNAKNQLREAHDLLAQKESQAEVHTAEIGRLTIELDQAKTEAADYAASRSWKLTRPLRMLNRMIQRGKTA